MDAIIVDKFVDKLLILTTFSFNFKGKQLIINNLQLCRNPYSYVEIISLLLVSTNRGLDHY